MKPRGLAGTVYLLVCAVAAALAALTAAVAQSAAPRRILSFNLCADELVLALADPDQIAGLSPYAADPSLSVMAEEARAYRRVDWQAESTIPLSPDLILISPVDRPVTRRLLMSLGYRTEEIELVSDIEAARAQILRVAALLGHPERGERLVADVDRARARLAAAPRARFATALVIERGGYTAGPESLAAALVAEAGFRAPLGSPGGYGSFIPLERLVMLDPDLLLIKDPPRAPTDQGALYFLHPALARLYPPERRLALPSRYTLCGGPALVAALDYMTGIRTRLAAPRSVR